MYISLHNSVRDDKCRQAAYILPMVLEIFRYMKYILQVSMLQWAYIYIGVQSEIHILVDNVFLLKIYYIGCRDASFPHDGVIKRKHFPRYWLFVRVIHRSPVNSPCGTSKFSLICAWINGWINKRAAGDLRRHRAHYDVTVVFIGIFD